MPVIKTIIDSKYVALFGGLTAFFAGLTYFVPINFLKFIFGFLGGLSLVLLVACGLEVKKPLIKT